VALKNIMNYNPSYVDENIILSSEEIKHFRDQNIILNKEISDILSRPDEKRLVIGDGVFDYEGYLKSKIKILWIMKEPYDTSGGGWHISEIFKNKTFGAARTTWYPIINVSHSILSGLEKWDKRERVSKSNLTTSDVLSHIAYMNVQKLPSLTREKTNNSEIHKAFNDKVNLDFFKRQFELLNPDIIIGANTLWMMVFALWTKRRITNKQSNRKFIHSK
jgi:hypothetical protein